MIRRTILADRASELKDAQARRDVLLRQRTEIESKLATPTLSTQEVAELKERLNVLTTNLASASTLLESMRAGFDEETRLATDLRSEALVEAQRKEAVGQCCEAIRTTAVGAVDSSKQPLIKATDVCAQMNNVGATFAEVSKALRGLVPGTVLPTKCSSK